MKQRVKNVKGSEYFPYPLYNIYIYVSEQNSWTLIFWLPGYQWIKKNIISALIDSLILIKAATHTLFSMSNDSDDV